MKTGWLSAWGDRIGQLSEDSRSALWSAGFSLEGIASAETGDIQAYRSELNKFERQHPGSIFACTTGYALWFNSVGASARRADEQRIDVELRAIEKRCTSEQGA